MVKNKREATNKCAFSAPGYYRVTVGGRLTPDWTDRLGGLRIKTCSGEADSDLTVLQGRVSDQAELSGILNTLYELHLPLLSVEYLGKNRTTGNPTGGCLGGQILIYWSIGTEFVKNLLS
jgi:hypothetical protein